MSTTVKTGWLKDNYGEKFAPKTLASQVVTPDGQSFEDKINEQLENVDVGIEITKEEYDALGDVVLTDGKTYFITDIDGGGSGSGGGIANTDGIVVNVEVGNWTEQSDGTYINVIDVENVSIKDVYDISLYGDYSEEQAYAFDFLVTSIDTYNNKVVLTASEAIDVAFSIVLRGKVNLENKNVYVSDLSATNIEYDNSKSGFDATNMQNAMDEVATIVNGLVVNITTDSWDLQEDGSYKKIVALEQITGNEVFDVCLYPGETHSEEQITAFSELVSSIETEEGRIVLTAVEEITVSFKIFLYGKVNFGKGNLVALTGSVMEVTEISKENFEKLSEAEKANGCYYVSDGDGLVAKNLEYDGSESGLGNNVQDAIDELSEQNKNLGWKLLGSATANGEVKLTSIEFSELHIKVKATNSSGYTFGATFNFIKEDLSSGDEFFSHGAWIDAGTNEYIRIKINLNSVATNAFTIATTNHLSYATMEVYYR